jgi:hypothetical protein
MYNRQSHLKKSATFIYTALKRIITYYLPIAQALANNKKLAMGPFLAIVYVDAQNFLIYHVSLCEWDERGLSCLKGVLSPKLYTGLVGLFGG